MQPMRSCVMKSKVPPFLFFEGRGFFFKLCLVWRVDCPLFTFHLDSGQLTFQGSFWGAGVFPWSSQEVPKGFSKFPVCSPICFYSTTLLSPMLRPKVLPFLTYIARPMGRHSILQQQTFILGSLQSFSFFFCDGPINVTLCNQKNQELENTLHLS